ncbi:MAG: RNA methyltransferase [Candidatus Sumerlaeaceae bacterium]
MARHQEEITMFAPLYAALLHYPIRDKHDHAVATAITNLDIHDIARSAKTFGLAHYFVVTPVKAQRWLAHRILEHWNTGWGATYNPNRKDALSLVSIVPDLGHVSDAIERSHGTPPLWIATSARRYPNTLPLEALAQKMHQKPELPLCLILGTGWGLHPELILDVDYVLEPILGVGSYNHLSVRAAAAIIFHQLARLHRSSM